MTASDAGAILSMLEREQQQFARRHPVSLQRYRAGERHYLYGAPSHWMRRWAGGFPLSVETASGAHVRCADGVDYVDFCLGDTGGMCGHAHPAVTLAVAAQLARGATLMLPTADAQWVGAELARRFGLPYWGFTTSATDANRAAIRMARQITGRDKVLVFNGCYHGSVEEAHVALQDGRLVMRNGIHPNAVDHARVSVVVEFNDPAALAQALSQRDIACVLTEPLMTNYGMILPQPGFHATLREMCTRYGTLLVLDETHTLSTNAGGYMRSEGLHPDMFVVGKAVGGGIPVGLYGLSEAVAAQMWALVPKVNPTAVRQSSHLGFGGTLAGSALQVAAVRSVLEHVLVDSAYERMVALATQLAAGAREVVRNSGFAWYVEQVGARLEIMFAPRPPLNAAEVARDRNGPLESLLHVYFMNRGVLITPFHCMLLVCPATAQADAGRFLAVLGDFCAELKRECCGNASAA